MAPPRSLTRLSRIVETDARLKAWNDRRLREEALLRSIRRVLPRPVAERVVVVDGDRALLELATGTGAIASVVRQRGPDILLALAREGREFSGIRVRVQPRPAPPSPEKPEPRQWDSHSRQALTGLEARLSAGPLKTALSRLLRGRKRTSG